MGLAGIGSIILTSFYAFGGTEMIAVTGGELKNENDVPKVINWTLLILVLSYIMMMIIIGGLLPWDQADLNGSPLAYVFRNAGMGSAELVINIIVLTSALTSGNYFVYACTRYLWSLAKFEQACCWCGRRFSAAGSRTPPRLCPPPRRSQPCPPPPM